MEPFELERLSFPKHDKLNFEYGEGEDSMEPLSIYRYNDFVMELVIFSYDLAVLFNVLYGA